MEILITKGNERKRILHSILSSEPARMGGVVTAARTQAVNKCYNSYKPLNLRYYVQCGKPTSNERETIQGSP